MVTYVLYLGRVPYGTANELQRTLLSLRKAGSIENTLLLLEHPPVITLGRNARMENVLASPEFLAQRGVELFEIDRGGDVTFHGPGQLIAYPIFDLRSFDPKVGAVEFVRRLEEVLIRTCSDYGIAAQRIKGLTGVWTYALPDKPEAKIAAIGVHISRGVTTHGFALNVSTDLDFFSLIVPCGITDKPVTSIERETGRQLSLEEVATSASRNFGRVFNSQMLWLESLDDLLGSSGSRRTPASARSANQDTPARPPKELRELLGDGTRAGLTSELRSIALLAHVADPPDRVRAIVAHQQRTVGSNRHANWPSPHLPVGQHEAGQEVLVLSGRFAASGAAERESLHSQREGRDSRSHAAPRRCRPGTPRERSCLHRRPTATTHCEPGGARQARSPST